MWLLLLVFGFLVTCAHKSTSTSTGDSDYYTAAVVNYSPAENPRTADDDFITRNMAIYLSIIQHAKKENVDILVFPEGTLNYYSSRKQKLEYAFVVPDPKEKIAPWEHAEYSNVFRALSKEVHDARIYVLINVIEKVACNRTDLHDDGFCLFNTNVVMDRSGRVISKYQKYNLYLENLDKPSWPQHAVFTTDFGVKFGHFVCFDIIFREPAMELLRRENVSNLLFPSHWFSELPHLSSTQFHQGWAYANNVNLLSAGASFPGTRSGGSGIFLGSKKIANIIISPKEDVTVLISKVPKDIRSTCVDEIPEFRHQYPASAMTNFKTFSNLFDTDATSEIDITSSQTLCANDNICCSFKINMRDNDKISGVGETFYKYKVASNYTTRKRGNRLIGEFYCSIVACTSDDPKSCGHRFENVTGLTNPVEFESVEITAKINYTSSDDLMGSPNSLDTSLLPLATSKYIFTNKKTVQQGLNFMEYKITSTQPLKDLLTFGIFGRNFGWDDGVENNYV